MRLNIPDQSQFIVSTILASVLSSHGLMKADITSLVASMLISPIGSFIIMSGLLFVNSAISNYQALLTKTMLYFVIIVGITIIIGFLFGFFNKYHQWYPDAPTPYMTSRLQSGELKYTLLIAITCAVAFPVAVKHTYMELIIAIGIATALLPPLVNIGLFTGLWWHEPEKYLPYLKKLWVSVALFCINFTCLLVGLLVYIHLVNRGGIVKVKLL